MANKPVLSENAPWKKRFRTHSIFWGTLANLNPSRGLVCTDRDGIKQLYAWDVKTGELIQLTDHSTGVVNGMISSDGEFVYYLKDEGGNELGHFVRLPFKGGSEEDITPEKPPYSAFEINQSFDGTVLGSRLADPDGQHLYIFDQELYARKIHTSQHLFFGPVLSYNGEIAVIATMEGTGSLDTRLMAFDVKTGEILSELWHGEGISHNLGYFAHVPGDFRLLSTTSKSGYSKPVVWDPISGDYRELVVGDIPGEINPWAWSCDGKRVLLNRFHQAHQQLYLYDLETDRITKLEHPTGVLGNLDVGRFTEDDEIIITWQDSAHPSRLIVLDGKNGREKRTVLDSGMVPDGIPWQSVTFKSESGAEIQGWLAVPRGKGPFPTILHTHGGPTAVMTNAFSPESQAWLDHGFAFLTINYHGSTTFGKDFEKSILGNLGELEVQDMASGYHWLVENKIADPEVVFLTGGSYGGYLTLFGLSKRPDLWAGGMAGVAIADWATMYEDESESLRGYHRVMFGGPPEETPGAHKRSSPITYADQLQAPILVIQGTNDTRCPSRQMIAYEKELKSLGKEISIHWFEAGHGSRAQEQNIEHMELKLKFVKRVMRD